MGMGLSASRLLGSSKAKRASDDYYITPDIATLELLKREKFTGWGLDPCCGDGGICDHFDSNMSAIDIRVDAKRGVTADFLTIPIIHYDFMVFNPPFKYVLPFIKKALASANKVAIFARIQLLEGQERYAFFQEHPPKCIYVFSNRISCKKMEDTIPISTPAIICFCWFIWEKGYKGLPTVDWILCDPQLG